MAFEDLSEALVELGYRRADDFESAWGLSRAGRAKRGAEGRRVTRPCEVCRTREVVAEGRRCKTKYCSEECRREAHKACAREEWRRNGAARRRPLRAQLKAALTSLEETWGGLTQAERERVVLMLRGLLRWRPGDGAFVVRVWASSGETPAKFAARMGLNYWRLVAWRAKFSGEFSGSGGIV